MGRSEAWTTRQGPHTRHAIPSVMMYTPVMRHHRLLPCVSSMMQQCTPLAMVLLSAVTLSHAAPMTHASSTDGGGQWTWEGGSMIAASPSSPLVHNEPIARCCSQSWTVGQSLWVFGGAGVVPGGSAEGDFLGDMWELNTQTKQWTYHGGALKANPSGNRTFPSARNYGVAWARTTDTPQPRSVTMSAAAPTGVELWMWGGVGVRFQGDDTGAPLNDTWVYSVDTHTWSQRNITPGSPMPGARNWANFWSTDNGNTLWMYSGAGGADGYGLLSDMWRFSVPDNTWTPIFHGAGKYPAWTGHAAHPGARFNAYTMVDDVSNDLILYGGEGAMLAANGSELDGDFQDIWRFVIDKDGVSGTWQYDHGPQAIGLPAQYGTKGQAGPSNLPPAEHAGYILRVPYRGALWFLGGEDGTEQYGMRNDLWSYNLSTQEWTWESGRAGYNGTAVYGVKGVASEQNTPGARYAGMAFTMNDSLWIFGGYSLDAKGGMGYMNDVWSFS
eukprot:m.8943 g.8943  ORF g.8943 m.8943 type:complete len:498 (+) comp2580_c0_seq2:35-1528(+)